MFYLTWMSILKIGKKSIRPLHKLQQAPAYRKKVPAAGNSAVIFRT
jgi:hypothetical protein